MKEFIFNLNIPTINSNIIEAIKIFALTNANSSIYIVGGQSLKRDLSTRNYKNITFINNYNELVDTSNPRIFVNFQNTEDLFLADNNSFYILENNKKNICLLYVIDFSDPNLKDEIDKILLYKNSCLNNLNKNTFKLLDSIQFTSNHNYLNSLKFSSYDGVLDISNLFNNDEELLIVDSKVSSIILKTLISCQDYYTSQDSKSLASYFAKMTVQFQKSEKIFINNNFYKSKCLIKGKDLDLLISKDLSSSYIINTLNIIKR